MKKFIIMFAIVLVAGILITCGKNSTNEDDTESVVYFSGKITEDIVDFPNCITNPDNVVNYSPMKKTPRYVSGTTISNINALYSPIRNKYIPSIKSVRNFIVYLLDIVRKNVLDTDSTSNPDKYQTAIALQNALDSSGSYTYSADTSLKIYIGKNTGGDYEYSVKFYTTIDTDWFKYIDLNFSEDSGQYKGEVYVQEKSTDPLRTVSWAKFDGNDNTYGKYLEIKSINYIDTTVTENRALKTWTLAVAKDNVFRIVSNTYYELVNLYGDSGYMDRIIDDNDVTTAPGSNVKGTYYFSGIALVEEDSGIVELVASPSSVTDTTNIFTNYSIGKIYQRGLSQYLRENVVHWDYLNTTVIEMNSIAQTDSNVTEQTSIDYTDTTDQTDTNLITLIKNLSYCLDNYSDSFTQLSFLQDKLEDWVFVAKMDNPAYFDKNGFVGTESLNRPEWYTSFANISFLPNIYSPHELAQSGWTVTLPLD